MKGKRRRGHFNGFQIQRASAYETAILRIVNENPGLNLSEIARELQRDRDWSRYLPDFSPEFRKGLPPVGKADIRRTVRKHLVNLSRGRIRWDDRRYYPRALDEEVSNELIELVDWTILQCYPIQTISTDMKPTNWTFPVAENAAIFRTYVNPAPRSDPYAFEDFFDPQIKEFQYLFFLNQILVRAIGSGKLRPNFYDPTNNSLNVGMLRKGWADYFQDTKVLVGMYAINPTNLRIFLEKNIERDFLKKRLADEWHDILTRARQRRAQIQAMKPRLKKAQAQQESSRARNSAGSQSGVTF